MLSNEPFSDDDVARVHAACERFGFDLLAAPDVEPSTPLFGAVLHAHTRADLDRWVAGDPYTTEGVWRSLDVRPYRAAVGTWMPEG